MKVGIATLKLLIVKLSLWFLYTTIGGLLSMFLIMRNLNQLEELRVSSGLKNANVLYNKGELVILYFFGIVALSIAFFDLIKYFEINIICLGDG